MNGNTIMEHGEMDKVSANVGKLIKVMDEMNDAIAGHYFNQLPDRYFIDQISETVRDIRENGVEQYETFISKCHNFASSEDEKRLFREILRFVKSLDSKLRDGGITVRGERVEYL